MFNKLESGLTSRLTSTMLTAFLVAVLTAPFVMLQSMHAFAAPAPLPCRVGNYNGCIELSATPPQDIAAVPPNIVLMFDDSGSMAWDFMPDWDALGGGVAGWNSNNDGVRNPAINMVYYNPATVYTPPPYADSVDSSHLYPDSPGLLKAYNDGFLDLSKKDITAYTGGSVDVNTFPYYTTLAGAPTDFGPAKKTTTTTCPSGYTNNSGTCTRASSNPTTSTTYTCQKGDVGPIGHNGKSNQCRSGTGESATWYAATKHVSAPTCTGASTLGGDGKCHWPDTTPSTKTTYSCPSGGSANGQHECVGTTSIRAFTYALGTPGKYVEHYVASGNDCTLISNTTQQGNCVSDGDPSGLKVPVKNADGTVTMTTALAQDGSSLTAGQNVANWFSYYRTRMLMSKTGLMTGMSALDKSYRVGFASINGYATGSIPAGASSATAPYTFDDSMADGSGGKTANKLAVVQPFGDGSTGSQKANFWAWLVAEQPDGQTPLRKALNSAGQYYQTNQPWSAMTGDPGYTGTPKTYACRASYTILTTDGFWNGDDPGVPAMTNATDRDGPTQTFLPAGVTMTHYSAVPPFSGGSVKGVTSLADVATYYWENDLSSMANEVSAGGDAATWQHMTTYTIGLGFQPVNISPSTVAVTDIFGWARALDGGKSPNPDPADTTFAWPNPASNDVNNIADLVHTAVNGRGNYFNVTSKDDITNAFMAIGNILGGHKGTASAAVNASVLAVGAVTFRVGYDTSNWSGSFEAIALKNDGTLDIALPPLWDAGANLDAKYHTSSGYSTRVVYTVSNKGGTLTPLQFNVTNLASLDGAELAGLGAPALGGGTDTLDNRINYLLGDPTNEGAKAPSYRVRSTILGSILRSDPVYVAGATGNYRDSWPTFGTPMSPVKPPEADPSAQSFAAFVSAEATRTPMVYVGANDGMLHAFNAPVPTCTGGVDSDGNCKAYTPGTTDGQEAWAFVPRAVYANLGNLTNTTDFSFRPTVDATPVSRDVYFSSDKKWHTLLTGGVGLGGRGVYGLDITDPSTAFSASNVLWEFDSDTGDLSSCVTSDGTACSGNDLGYTVAQPNVARLANGEWVVLVPNGYFPDCTTSDFPTYPDKSACNAISAQAPKTTGGVPYSALFVLDAATGKVIAELKTPSAANGVTSFGLSKPVLGDYNNDQVDDVAFAGDAQGNLWRFDLSNATDPTKWTVTLAYKGNFNQPASPNHQGTQPITTMPRLFPDPTTNRFMVLFGTGKYLGMGDNSNTDVQAIIAVRDGGVTGTAYSQTDLVPQYMHEGVVAAGLPNAGATLRCVTGSATDTCTSANPSAINPITSGKGGWYVDLETKTGGVLTDAGERVVVNPGAIFASNTVVFETLITGSATTDACNPATVGALLAFNAITGGSGGVSSLGGQEIVGGRITNARTSGSLPTVSTLGGGKVYLPGATLSPGNTPISIDAPIWRRRSWRVLLNDQ